MSKRIKKSNVATEPKQMTLTLQSYDRVLLQIAGTGTMSIDWGDGTPCESHTLFAPDDNGYWMHDCSPYMFKHRYSENSTRTITITGENITDLDLDDGVFTGLDISNNVELQCLYLYDRRLTSLDVSRNTALILLCCDHNQFKSLDVSNNTKLECLSCSENQLTSLDVSKNTVLRVLSCSRNQLTSLDLNKNTSLERLYCDFNHLSNLDTSANTALTRLECFNNQIERLDVSKNTELNGLYCCDNQLRSLDLSKNIGLWHVECGGNRIASLDVSKNMKLWSLDCRHNRLSNLDVSNNTSLVQLNCNDNLLTGLDVSKNKSLEELYCNGNRLTILNLSNNAALTKLHCSENELTNLNVNANTELTELFCNRNKLKSLDISNTSVKGLISDFYLSWYWNSARELENLKTKRFMKRRVEFSIAKNLQLCINSPITNPQKINILKQFTSEQLSNLNFVCTPREMDEQWLIPDDDVNPYSSYSWIIFTKDKEWLYFHRPWSNHGIYKAHLLKENDGYCIREFWAERNPEIWTSNDNRDIEILSSLAAYFFQFAKNY